MNLPVAPPLGPMLAARVAELPQGDGWIFEPKWDGFRVLVFRDAADLRVQSREGKPLDRYFPELRPPLLAELPSRSVVDGEIVVARGGALDFEALQMRLHPAASRVRALAARTPASIVVWDLLCEGDRDLRDVPFAGRRAELEARLGRARPPIHVTPATTDRRIAADWFRRFEGAGLDGVVAKRADGVYESNKRVMLKVKHERECDCVVGGFRWHKGVEAHGVGSLLLGLYDDSGVLRHVGVAAGFGERARLELAGCLAPYRESALERHPWRHWAEGQPTAPGAPARMPGAQSRWSAGKDLAWEPLRPELVVEVIYDHMQGLRFRHTVHLRRWRFDKAPRACTYAQLEVVPPHEIAAIFSAPSAAEGSSVGATSF